MAGYANVVMIRGHKASSTAFSKGIMPSQWLNQQLEN